MSHPHTGKIRSSGARSAEATGPVVVTVEYMVRDEDAQAFCAAMIPVSQTRYRDGAFCSWTLSRCTENPERWLELFMVESWEEHLRQHRRVTMADRKLQAKASGFHAGPGRPKVSHFVSVDVGRVELNDAGR